MPGAAGGRFYLFTIAGERTVTRLRADLYRRILDRANFAPGTYAVRVRTAADAESWQDGGSIVITAAGTVSRLVRMRAAPRK